MFCKYCGKEYSGNFIFCPFCGKKISDKNYCPNCNNELSDDAKFCGNCGTFVGEKIAPTRVVKEPVYTTEKVVVAEKSPLERFNSVFVHVSSITLILGLLAMFVFSFFFGLTSSTEIGQSAMLSVSESSGTSFYFFKDIFNEISEILEEMIYEDNSIFGSGLYTFAIFCTIFIAMNMVVSFGMLVTACVRYGMAIFEKKTKTFSCLSFYLTAFSCFLITACVVGCFLNFSGKISIFGEKIGGSISLNGTTIAGVVVASVFCLLGLVFTCFKNKLTMANVINAIISIVAIGVIVASIIILTKNFLTMETVLEKYSQSAGSLSMSSATFFILFGIMFTDFSDTRYYQSFMTTTLISYIFFLFAIIFTVLLLASIIKSMANGKSFSTGKVIFGLFSFLSAIGYLALTIATKTGVKNLAKICLKYTLGTAPGFDLSLTGPIVVAILATVAFILAVVTCFIRNKPKNDVLNETNEIE